MFYNTSSKKKMLLLPSI